MKKFTITILLGLLLPTFGFGVAFSCPLDKTPLNINSFPRSENIVERILYLPDPWTIVTVNGVDYVIFGIRGGFGVGKKVYFKIGFFGPSICNDMTCYLYNK